MVPLIFMTRAAGLDKEFVPTVSMLFRLSINPREMWAASTGSDRQRVVAVVFLDPSNNVVLEARRFAFAGRLHHLRPLCVAHG